jgi:chromosome segregation ATPase
MASTETEPESETQFVRTTGLEEQRPTDERTELRARVAELESELARKEAVLAERNEEIARLRHRLDRREQALAEREADLEEARADLETAEEWAEFLDRELRAQRDRVGSLEARVESLESDSTDSRSLWDRLRDLF